MGSDSAWERVWAQVLFQRFLALLDIAEAPETDPSAFMMAHDGLSTLYGQVGEGHALRTGMDIQGRFHEMVHNFVKSS